ncbi:MAG TPA: hypothetical protein VGF13_09255, partial [Verrucomicrobiae bacterium]
FIAAVAILDLVFHFDPFGSISSEVFLAAWFFISVLIDLLLSFSASHNLRTQFRLVATQPLQSRAGFWERWLGGKPVEVKK